MTLRVLSLGAGVQSSALALMIEHGEFGDDAPDVAIFADTGDEPTAVYEQLAWLEAVLGMDVITVGSPVALSERLLDFKDDAARVPFHVGAGGMANRQCTRNFKLRPIRRKVRELMSDRGVAVAPGAVEQWIGISYDEAIRMKPSGVDYIAHRWPLVEMHLSRQDCLDWIRGHGYPTPPKSSCVFCPYRRNDQWRELRETDPGGWRRACEVDAKLRLPENVARFRGELFAHRSRVPLAQAALSRAEEATRDGQTDLFLNECEGMCGV